MDKLYSFPCALSKQYTMDLPCTPLPHSVPHVSSHSVVSPTHTPSELPPLPCGFRAKAIIELLPGPGRHVDLGGGGNPHLGFE